MKRNRRLSNAALAVIGFAGLAAIGFALVSCRSTPVDTAQNAPSASAESRSQEARLLALPGTEVSQPRLLGRGPRPYRLLL